MLGADTAQQAVDQLSTLIQAASKRAPNTKAPNLIGFVKKCEEFDGSPELDDVADGTGNVELFNVMVDRGADPHKHDKGGRAPLFYAAMKGDVAMIEAIVNAGCDVNDASSAVDGYTPLHAAAQNGHKPALRKLVALGANLDAVAPGLGATAAVISAGTGMSDVVELLHDLGADMELAVSEYGVHEQMP
eukprot:gene13300-1454_t